jgi:hypothetical protein
LIFPIRAIKAAGAAILRRVRPAAVVVIETGLSERSYVLYRPRERGGHQSALAKLVQGKTLLVIAHRLSTIADADQIIVVNLGRIEATGTQAELLGSCPLYRTMWEAHISVKDDGEVA